REDDPDGVQDVSKDHPRQDEDADQRPGQQAPPSSSSDEGIGEERSPLRVHRQGAYPPSLAGPGRCFADTLRERARPDLASMTHTDATSDRRPLVIASNRGPASFAVDEHGEVAARRGAGGLVTALIGALQASGGLWIASAMSEIDREHAGSGRIEIGDPGARYSVRYLAFDPGEFHAFYNEVSNRVLWMLHHCLWDA